MYVCCAWCDKDMGEKPPYDNQETTHGICPECFDLMMLEIDDIERETKRLREVTYNVHFRV